MDDIALVPDSEGRLRQLVKELERVWKRRKLMVNESKNKAMKCTRRIVHRRMNVALKERLPEEGEDH